MALAALIFSEDFAWKLEPCSFNPLSKLLRKLATRKIFTKLCVHLNLYQCADLNLSDD